MNKKIGIILGSGLNKFTNELEASKIIFEDSDSFHKLKIYSGRIEQNDIILFSGRKHFYEGYSEMKVLENINLANELGVKLMLITNAAGGINKNFEVSDLMLITSHYNLLNKRIPVKICSSFYEDSGIKAIKQFAREEKINLKYGSYLCSSGPMYETKSEIRFLSRFGIDAVGMSTIPEILYANKLGIKTFAFSCITNLLSENSESATHHSDVLEAGMNAYRSFSKLMKKIISKSAELCN